MTNYNDRMDQLNGVRHGNRLSPLIHAGAIPVDEREMAHLLVALKAYAENIKFYNLSNSVDGTWGSLFAHSEILSLSTVMAIKVDRLRENYLQQRTFGLLASMLEVKAVLDTYERWFQLASSFTQTEALNVLVKSKMYFKQRLSSTLIELEQFFSNENKPGLLEYPLLSALLAESAQISSEHRVLAFNRFSRSQKDKFLLQAYELLIRGLDLLSKDANAKFNSLLTQQQHEPAVGLLVAFLQSYQKTQKITNEFSSRLLEFYEKTILKNTPAAGEVDRVILHCTLQPGEGLVKVANNTQFNAGKTDTLDTMHYVTVADSYLSGAKLMALRTLFLQRHEDISPNNVSGAVTRVKTYDLYNNGASPDIKMNVFGYEAGSRPMDAKTEAEIGLYVASNLLTLKEGRREITLVFQLRDKALVQLESMRSRFQSVIKAENPERVRSILFDSLDSTSLFFALLKDRNLDLKQTSVAIGLYKSFSTAMKNNTDILNGLLQYCAKQLQTESLSHWEDGEVFSGYEIFKHCLLYLYRFVSNVTVLGRIHAELISRHLFVAGFLTPSDRQLMDKAICHLSDLDDRDRMKVVDMKLDISQQSSSCLIRYFQNAFECHLSQESGWLVHRNYHINHCKKSIADGGFSITLTLPPDTKPIVKTQHAVHGPLHRTDKPVLMLRVNRFCRSFPLSWFENFWVAQAKIAVNVKGYRDVTIHNEYGQVDANKPFMPFSSIPQHDSRFYIGGYEYARKNITALGITLTWKNQPKTFGGLLKYYQGYGKGMANHDFNVNLTLLSHGELVPGIAEMQQQSCLFHWHPTSQVLSDSSAFEYHFTQGNPKIEPDVSRLEYDNLANVDHGYLCLRLRSSEKAFGHKLYPTLLSNVLTYNARRKRKHQTLPLTPYTPEISRVEIDYRAEDTLKFATDFSCFSTQQGDINRLEDTDSLAFHQWPMGLGLARSTKGHNLNPLFPQPNEDGNLYLGFAPSRSVSRLCIYIELNKDSTRPASAAVLDVKWRYYSASGWKDLSHNQLLSDSTSGLQKSGIVTLTLPNDACEHPGFLPAHQYWLCLSHAQPRQFATLRALSFDAIELKAEKNALKLSKHRRGFSSSWAAVKDIAGLQKVSQTEPAFANGTMENDTTSTTRLLERLRHKNRPITPWDYERIVLEHFPNVELVKCLPNCQFKVKGYSPGRVLIVVMPSISNEKTQPEVAHHLNAVTLQEISKTLTQLAPPTAIIDVVNATYEFVQVRCAVQFTSLHSIGDQTKQLQKDISTYISPWSVSGLSAEFSWVIRTKELEAYLRGLPYLKTITRVSLVKCFGDSQFPEYFSLDDTAKASNQDLSSNKELISNNAKETLRASYPWSLSLPSKNHSIELLNTEDDDYDARPVGINTLEIGNTFVIRGRETHA